MVAGAEGADGARGSPHIPARTRAAAARGADARHAELISEAGLEGATVRAIAERAKVTPGLIRHHFHSKEELILAAYDHHMTRMTEASFANAGRTAQSARQRSRLARFVGRLADAAGGRGGGGHALGGFIARLRHDPACGRSTPAPIAISATGWKG